MSPALFGGSLTLVAWGKLPGRPACWTKRRTTPHYYSSWRLYTSAILIANWSTETRVSPFQSTELVLDHAPRILFDLVKNYPNTKNTLLYRMPEDQNITNSMKLCALKDCSNYPLTNILHATNHALYTWARWGSDESIQVQKWLTRTLVKCTRHTW